MPGKSSTSFSISHISEDTLLPYRRLKNQLLAQTALPMLLPDRLLKLVARNHRLSMKKQNSNLGVCHYLYCTQLQRMTDLQGRRFGGVVATECMNRFPAEPFRGAIPLLGQAASTCRHLTRSCFFLGGQNIALPSSLNLPTKTFQKGRGAREKIEAQLKAHQKCNVYFFKSYIYLTIKQSLHSTP